MKSKCCGAEMTDAEWATKEAKGIPEDALTKAYPHSVLYWQGLTDGLAEGRRRERAELLDSAEVVNASARIISEAICQQREEAAAREAWRYLVELSDWWKDVPGWINFVVYWKQRKSQGGIGV